MSGVTAIELRFPEFSDELKTHQLGSLLDITSASRVHKDEWTESGVPFFRSSDVVSHYKGLSNRKAYISRELFERLSEKKGSPKKGDLLVTGGGSIGIPFLVSTNDPLYFKDADLLWFRSKDRVNSAFLYAFLLTPTFKKYLTKITHIGTIAHYTVEQAKATPIKLPTIPEQKKIAAFLSVVDEKLAALEAQLKGWRTCKRGMMQDLFSQRLRFKANDGSNYPDWEQKRLGKIAQFKKGKGISKADINASGEQKCIRYGELYTTYREVIDTVVSSTDTPPTKPVLSQGNDILMPTSDVTPTGLATASALSESGVILGGDVLIIRSEKILNKWFAFWVAANTQKIMRLVSGATVYHIYGSDMATIRLSLPTVPEQQKIADALSAIDAKIDALTGRLEATREFKRGLLQKMFV